MQQNQKLLKFIEDIKLALNKATFVRIKVSKPVDKSSDLREIDIRLVEIKNMMRFSFVYHYKTKDITKNFELDEGIETILGLLGIIFKNCVLFTIGNDIHLSYNKKMEAKLDYIKASSTTFSNLNHNKEKKYFIKIENNEYLKELGVIDKSGEINQGMGSKYKQISKYIETLDGIIKNSNISKGQKINVVDMGCGKGHLTFAIYDYFVNNLKIDAEVSGIEMRKDLVDLSSEIAKKSNFNNLYFYKSTIQDYTLRNTNILIALHACDTATDDAIFKGIKGNCSIIILSPCCHKQIRKEFDVKNELNEIVKHGILKERMAEIVTDTMRGLILEAYGYKTQIFEYISDEHTHKNVMIVGVKKNNNIESTELLFEKIKNIKKTYGIKKFYLENLFNKKL